MAKEESVILKVTVQMGVGTGQGRVQSQACCWRDQGLRAPQPRGSVRLGLCADTSTGLGGQGPHELGNTQHRSAKLHLELLLHLGSFRDEPHQCWH